MKILIDIRLLGRERQSGVAEYTFNIVDHLIKLAPPNFRFQLFYNGLKKEPLPEHWLTAPNTYIINSRYPNKIFNVASFVNLPIDKFIKTDLIFSPHIDLLSHNSTPRILTVHDLSFLHYKHFFSRKQRLWHYFQKIKKQVAQANHIIANSEYTKKDIMETLGISENKISVIYPGIGIPNKITEAGSSLSERIVPASTLARVAFLPVGPTTQESWADKKAYSEPPVVAGRERGMTAGGFILYLGTLEPRKNIPAIIKAFNIIKSTNKYPDLKLVLAGRPGWLYKDIVKEARRSPYRQEIIFWGLATVAEKNMLYNSARAFIYPSFFEGFGFPPLEAQANGCPVIISNRSSLSEIMGDSALKINPWRTDQLATAIDQILSDQTLRKKLIAAGRENIKKFNWQLCAQKLLKIFSGYC